MVCVATALGKEGLVQVSPWYEGPGAVSRPELDPGRTGAVCFPGCIPSDQPHLNPLEQFSSLRVSSWEGSGHGLWEVGLSPA